MDERDRLRIELVSGGFRLHAFSPIPPNIDPMSLMGAKVLLKGTAGTTYNAPLRHFMMVTLYVPRLEDFTILQPAPTNLFNEPLIPLNDIAQYRRDSSPAKLVHVKGVVTYQRKGKDLFLQDATGGLQVKSKTDRVCLSRVTWLKPWDFPPSKISFRFWRTPCFARPVNHAPF